MRESVNELGRLDQRGRWRTRGCFRHPLDFRETSASETDALSLKQVEEGHILSLIGLDP